MEQYLFKIDHTYTDKNKLYKAFRNHVQELDGTLIRDYATLQAFKQSLFGRLEQLNSEFSRCKPVELQTPNFMNRSDKDYDSTVMVSGSWSATFYKIHRAVELQDCFLQYFIPDQNNPRNKPPEPVRGS